MEVKKVKIADLGKVITGSTPSKSQPDYYGDFMLWIKPTDMNEGMKYTCVTEEMFSKKAAEECKTRIIPKDSILIPCIGTVGTKLTMSPCDCFTNQSVNAIIPNSEFDNHYIYYLMLNYLPSLKMLNKGTASGREYIAKSDFENIELNIIADKSLQKRLGQILSAYDDLIENCRKQIALHEEAAQRLYREWFVDFRFPGYENVTFISKGLPLGWQECKIKDLAEINSDSIDSKYPFPDIEYIDLGSVRNGIIGTAEKFQLEKAPGRARRLAQEGDIIWGMVRPNLKSYALVMTEARNSVYSTGFCVLRATKIPFSYLYQFVTTDAFVSYLVNCTNGAAYPAVKAEHFGDASIILPNKELVNQYHHIVLPIIQSISDFKRQIRNLTEARDRLLPKLMSGEINLE